MSPRGDLAALRSARQSDNATTPAEGTARGATAARTTAARVDAPTAVKASPKAGSKSGLKTNAKTEVRAVNKAAAGMGSATAGKAAPRARAGGAAQMAPTTSAAQSGAPGVPNAAPNAATNAASGTRDPVVDGTLQVAVALAGAARQPRSGTQSIERAVLVLKELAAQPHFGWRATDLAARCGLDRATTHRILASLARSRLAQQRPSDKRYMIGPLLFELAVGLPGMEELRRLSEDAMERLARRAHAVAFFYLRSGSDFTCLARAGTAPIQSLMFEVGTRRPLMSSAGGVAILLAMPPAECAAAVAENRARLRRWETPMDGIERIWEESVRTGRAVNRAATVAGWNAFAVPVRDASGAPFGAVMLAGIADEFPGAREEAHREMLAETAATIERALARGFDRSKRIAV